MRAVVSRVWAVTVQRRFCAVFGRQSPTKMSTYKWYKLLNQTGCICKAENPGRGPDIEAEADTVRVALDRSRSLSTRHAACRLNMSYTHNSAQNSAETSEIRRLQSTCLTPDVKLNNDTIPAGPFTAPLVIISNNVRHKTWLRALTYSNAFRFHSCVFQFMSNATLNGIHFMCSSCI
jgi:hypothetical protein